jgi:hypothetical protein
MMLTAVSRSAKRLLPAITPATAANAEDGQHADDEQENCRRLRGG